MTGMKNRFVLTYVLLVIAQMLLCNYFHFTPYIMLTILPIMVFCIPTRVSVFWTLIIAFVTGLAVDYFAEGIRGKANDTNSYTPQTDAQMRLILNDILQAYGG